ncbi:MAG: hypothetical protein ACE5G1_15370 [bacterium]
MSQFSDELSLKELLDNCSDPRKECWESAWRVFVRRYKKYIYDVLFYRCYKYSLPRLKLELSEIINDLFEEVIILLCTNNCQALAKFRARENEAKFRAWLRIICTRKADSYIRKHYVPELLDKELGEMQNFLGSLDIEYRWQFYEDYVALLRRNQKSRRQNSERDINIFNLYVWSDFTMDMITTTPCLSAIGRRVVDVVVNRTRKFLRENRKYSL